MNRIEEHHRGKKKDQKNNFGKRIDSFPIKLISREELQPHLDDYFKRGGKITKITDADIQSRTTAAINSICYDEATNFLNGD